MGGEQSVESRGRELKRGKSVPERGRKQKEEERPGSCSPGLSVCSDSELPYISYTVNRPIGDSPKRGVKGGLRGSPRKGALRKSSLARAQHNVIVVKAPTKETSPDQDPDILRLQTIPLFLPIMRSTLSVPAARDPEVLERLDPRPLHRLCLRTQRHMTESALSVANQQDKLTTRIKQMEAEVSGLVSAYLEREKAYRKHAEALSKVSELTAQIAKCHLVLNKTLDSMEALSNLLPPEDRLEPFVWTTG